MPKIYGFGCVFDTHPPPLFLVHPFRSWIVVDLPAFEEEQVVSLDHLPDRGGGNGWDAQSPALLVHKGCELLFAPSRKLFSLGPDESNNPGINPHCSGCLGTGGGRREDNEMIIALLQSFFPHPDGFTGNPKGFLGCLFSIPLVEGKDLHPFFGYLLSIKFP